MINNNQGTTSLSDILVALENAVRAVNNLNTTLSQVFPGATAVSTAALGAYAGTISIVSSSGAAYTVPVYT